MLVKSPHCGEEKQDFTAGRLDDRLLLFVCGVKDNGPVMAGRVLLGKKLSGNAPGSFVMASALVPHKVAGR